MSYIYTFCYLCTYHDWAFPEKKRTRHPPVEDTRNSIWCQPERAWISIQYGLLSECLYLTWGAYKLPDGNISRRAHVAGSGVLRTPICVYETRSTRQPNQFELALHYAMSFAQKLRDDWRKIKIRPRWGLNSEPLVPQSNALTTAPSPLSSW